MPLIHGRFGYGVPKAKRNSIVLDEVEDNTADYFPAAAPSNARETVSAPQSTAASAAGIQATFISAVI